MKYLRLFALVLAVGLTHLGYAQQEIDPDHFDHPASKPAVQKVQRSASHHRSSRLLAAGKKRGKKLRSSHYYTSV
jgi:hypothetical protein